MRATTRGFTLIELLVVVALISIMVAVAVPSFAAFIANYRATSSVNDLLQAITLTRSEAMKRGRRVTLAPIGGDWKNGWTVFVDVSPVTTPPSLGSEDQLIFKHDALFSSTTVTATDSATSPFGGSNYVAFDGTGYPRTTSSATLSGGIVVTDSVGSKVSQRTLCLAMFGRPRVAQGAVACSSG